MGPKSGLTKDHARRNTKYGGGYLVLVEGLHHLHCLVSYIISFQLMFYQAPADFIYNRTYSAKLSTITTTIIIPLGKLNSATLIGLNDYTFVSPSLFTKPNLAACSSCASSSLPRHYPPTPNVLHGH